VLDIARELLRLGHQPVCYSPILGEVADDLLAATIPVTDQLSNIQLAPDVIHGQHHMETLAALLQFPGVPAVQYCHGWLPWQEAPVVFPRVRHYVAVSQVGLERLVLRHGIAAGDVSILPNFFDQNRFAARRDPLPAKPKKALLLSNVFDAEAAPVREACRRFDISLDVVGLAAGSVHSKPENLLPSYDLVFTLGRGAIEAMATGAAVICLAEEGAGPLVSTTNFDKLRALNFGIRAVIGPLEPDEIAQQIELYNPNDAAVVSRRIHSEAALGAAVTRLLEIYNGAIASNQPWDPENESRAMAAYLSHWSPRFRDWAHRSGQADRALQDHAQRLETDVRNLRGELRLALTRSADILTQSADMKRQMEESWRQAEDIRNSRAWRISSAILSFKPISLLAGRFRANQPQNPEDAGDKVDGVKP
jgi:hypothetical protein